MRKLFGKDLLDEKNLKFFIIETILTCPTGAFRGTKKCFFERMGIENVDETRLNQLDKLLNYLKEKNYIKYIIDEDVFITYPKNNAIDQIDINKIMDNCKNIVEENHNNKETYFQLIKMWIIMEFCLKGGYLSYKKILDLTGFSENQIRNIKKLLMTNTVFQYSPVGLYFKNRKGRF